MYLVEKDEPYTNDDDIQKGNNYRATVKDANNLMDVTNEAVQATIKALRSKHTGPLLLKQTLFGELTTFIKQPSWIHKIIHTEKQMCAQETLQGIQTYILK